MNAREILDRIWAGRVQLRKVCLDPNPETVTIVMSVHAHMLIMMDLDRLEIRSFVEVDYSLPANIRIWGFVVHCDPTFADHEIRFRSEVAL